ncbi:MAG: AsnC-family transcriptional regulator NadR [uncultured bacterium]|nr:MAG: AsnC-family transcriptional regulator NadR [uncultured bacterium]
MKALFPTTNVVHVTDENPQEPHEHPDFWAIWKNTILRAMPEGVDYVFASEEYGWELARILNARYIPVNHSRDLVPVSATKIRKNPMKYWDFIPPPVRPYFVKRVCILGPESTGKSTLTRKLAEHFNTVFVSEYARDLLDFKNGQCDYEDIPLIAKGHFASEEALVPHANRVIFCDTDALTTTIWSKALFKRCPEEVESLAKRKNYDLYLLMDIDVPWVNDNQRFLGNPEQRQWFMELCRTALEKHQKTYTLISGNWDERFQKAVRAVSSLLTV